MVPHSIIADGELVEEEKEMPENWMLVHQAVKFEFLDGFGNF